VSPSGVTSASEGQGPASEPTVTDVLDLWFGPERGPLLSDPQYVNAWSGIWFGGQRSVEQLKAFEPLILRANEGSLTGADWETDAGLLAQIILLDQFARELWRGSPSAFVFDARACELAERLLANGLGRWETGEAMFVVMPLMHSELLEDHDKLRAALAADTAERQGRGLPPRLEGTAAFAESHRTVVERFGRYPHRNVLRGRASTPEEQRWLEGEAPSWARSQQPAVEGPGPLPPPRLAQPADSRNAVRVISLDIHRALQMPGAHGALGDVQRFIRWAARRGYVLACASSAAEPRRADVLPAAGLGPMIHFGVCGEAALDMLLERGRAVLPELEPWQVLHVGSAMREDAEVALAHGFRAVLLERSRSRAERCGDGGKQDPEGIAVVTSLDDVRLRLESTSGTWTEE